MPTLLEDLQSSQDSLKQFHDLTVRVLNHIPNVVSDPIYDRGYRLYTAEAAGTSKSVRPIKDELFVFDPAQFTSQYKNFMDLIHKLKTDNKDGIVKKDYTTVDKVAYTMQQSVGAGLDLLDNPNSAKKHVGNRFEELLRLIITELGISNKKIVFSIPYRTDEGEELYKCETDIVMSPYHAVKSDAGHIDSDEIVISSKTTSKDRMGKIFIDKLLLQKFTGKKDIKVVGIFQNDVQRSKRKNGTLKIAFTLVARLFMVYTQFLTQMEAVYFVDPPPHVFKSPWNNHIFPFSKFIIEDVWQMLSIP